MSSSITSAGGGGRAPNSAAPSIFAATAARSWDTATPSGAGSQSARSAAASQPHYTPMASAQHHKQRSSFPMARFRPASWEVDELGNLSSEERAERQLAGWQQGWTGGGGDSNTNSKRMQDVAPYTQPVTAAVSPRIHSHGNHTARWAESSLSASSSQSKRTAGTMTESWGSYGNAVARVNELGSQVEHLLALNAQLDAMVVQRTRERDEIRLGNGTGANQQAKHQLEEAKEQQAATLQQQQSRRSSHVTDAASSSNSIPSETATELSQLREQVSELQARLASQASALSAAQQSVQSLTAARDVATLQLSRVPELRDEVRALQERIRERDRRYQQSDAAIAQGAADKAQLEKQLQERSTALSDCEKRLAEAKASADQAASEHAAAAASAASTNADLSSRLAEREERIKTLEAEMTEFQATVAAAKERVEAEAAAREKDLEEARQRIAQLQKDKDALEADVAASKARDAARVPPPPPPAVHEKNSKTCVVM